MSWRMTAVAMMLAPMAAQEPSSLAASLVHLGEYAATFQRQLSQVVAEERYVQDVTFRNLAPGRFVHETHRELRSDLLLVRPAGMDRYVAFRDVFEVDGRPIRDRENRLAALFLERSPSGDALIRRINDESARFNIGPVDRNINTPTLALEFVLPRNQPRFRFMRGQRAAPSLMRAPADGAPIDFEEVQRPTLVHNTSGLDLPVRGRVWLDGDGRVPMTELVAEDTTVRATVDVRYEWDPRAGLMLPAEMRERYEVRRDGAVIVGTATYGDVRRFDVQTETQLGQADPKALEAPLVATFGPGSIGSSLDAVPSLETPPASNPAPSTVPPAQPPPSFESRAELVLVDFVVSDRRDRLVSGLTAGNFVVKEDGRAQPIVSFQAFASDRSSEPPDWLTAILVDDRQMTAQQAARLRPALKTLLTKLDGHRGRLALVAPASGVSFVGVLPTDAGAASAAVDRIAGQRLDDASNLPLSDSEALAIFRGDLPTLGRVIRRFLTMNPELNADQAETFARERAAEVAHDARVRRDALYAAALRSLDWLAGTPGRRSLVIASGGFASDPDDGKYAEVVTRSLRANAPIHFLDARGLLGPSAFQDAAYGAGLSRGADEAPFARTQAAEGSAGLADDTGGIVVGGTNDLEKGLGRILDTMTTYYVIAYQPPNHDKAGFHRISVEVHGKDLRVRARRGYADGRP